MIRSRGGTTPRESDSQDSVAAEPVQSVGTQLRSAREARGLDLLAVHDHLGRPITQIEALETGDMGALPDRSLALSTLRRYATFLGLDADALVEEFTVEQEIEPAGTSAPAGRSTAAAAAAAATSVVTAVTAGPEHLRAFTETGEVPRVAGRGTSTAGTSSSYDYSAEVGPPTGTFPVVPRADLRKSRRSVARARRRMRAPTSLRVITWIAAVLVLIVAVGFVLLTANPRVLANAHILRVAPAGSSATTGGSSNPTSTVPRQAFPVQSSGSSDSSASYSVATTKFTVVVATSGPCWVQITSSSSPVPLVSGVQQGAKVLSFPAVGTMTVEVGSSAVLVGITIKGKNAFTDAPKVVPFTYTFAPAG